MARKSVIGAYCVSVLQAFSAVTVLFAVSICPSVIAQTIVSDGTTGSVVDQQATTFTITGGTRAGSNLFHSFDRFGLDTGFVAEFQTPVTNGPERVISRVSGDSASFIDGTLRLVSPGTDFYFFNPNGVGFGPNAQLDINGSLFLSTANSLRFPDGARLHADLSETSTFSSAAPSDYGFLPGTPAPIQLNNTRLEAPLFSNLHIVAGDIDIAGPGAVLKTSAGDISVFSTAGGVTLPISGPLPETTIRDGLITLDDGATVDSSLQPFGLAGNIALRGGSVHVTNGATLTSSGGIGDIAVIASDLRFEQSGSIFNANFGTVDSGGIFIITDTLTISGNPIDTRVFTGIGALALGEGRGSDIAIVADQITLTDRGTVITSTSGSAAAGNIDIIANDIDLTGTGGFDEDFTAFLTGTGIFVTTLPGAAGAAGTATLNAGEIAISGGAKIQANNVGQGPAGAIILDADVLIIDGDAPELPDTGIFSNFDLLSFLDPESFTGLPGPISIFADHIDVRNGGQIVTANFSDAAGADIEIEAGEVHLVDSNPLTQSGIRQITGETSLGGAGGIVVDAGDIIIRRGGIIESSTTADGQAAPVELFADRLQIAAEGSVPESGDFFTGVRSSTLNIGGAAPILVDVSHLDIQNGGSISSVTGAPGASGGIQIFADKIDIGGPGPSGLSGISSDAFDSTGNSGNITIETGSLIIRGVGQISALQAGQGEAGDITISTGPLFILGNSKDFSGISASTLGVGAVGQGGSIRIDAGDIVISNGGNIGNITTGTADAGSVIIRAQSLTMFGQGRPVSETDEEFFGDLDLSLPFEITGSVSGSGGIESSTASTGNGGLIMLEIDRINLVNTGQIGSSTIGGAEGSGRGGEIIIRTRELRMAGASAISAGSTGTGSGGNIRVDASERVILENSGIATAGFRSDGGDITVNAVIEIRLNDSVIGTSVLGGSGDGGNISIDPQFLILNDSTIQANAVGGNGGNISIRADTILQSTDSSITATSDLAVDGNVDIEAPNQEAETGVAGLNVELLDGASRLLAQCDTNGGIARANFKARSRSGIAVSPESVALVSLGTNAGAPVGDAQADLQRPGAEQTGLVIVVGCR